jgi:hypothetical protein
VHDGYFSIDKARRWTDTADNNQASRDNAERAYSLIMKDKEKLLGFETKLNFIFSHSALKEGWDNPNVFQICALREIGTECEPSAWSGSRRPCIAPGHPAQSSANGPVPCPRSIRSGCRADAAPPRIPASSAP